MTNAKETLDLILHRQSDRKYSDRSVESDKIDRITEAGRMAPSACNSQPWKFIVVNDPMVLKDLARAAVEPLTGMNSFAGQAPVIIVIVRENPNFSSKFGSSVKRKDYSRIDIGITCQNICLQATAEGLGSCILGWFDEKKVRKILRIPSSKRVELLITLGYAESEYREKRRKPKDQVVSYNTY
ncbi:MAG: nitroreductase family protein [Bacteroidales bacterium]